MGRKFVENYHKKSLFLKGNGAPISNLSLEICDSLFVMWFFCRDKLNDLMFKSYKDLSPEGTLRSRAQWGPFDILSILLCLEKGVGTFKIPNCRRPFWNVENVLSPKGTLRSRTRMGSIWYSFHLLCLEKGVGTFKFTGGERPFWNLQNGLSPERTLPKQNP